jgi:adenylate cyclase class IV
MQSILKSLGFVVLDCIKKHRVSYEVKGVRVDIDQYMEEYAYVPEFLEIEAKSLKEIHAFAKELGFNPEKSLPWTTTQVLEHYAKKKKR